MLNTKGFVVLLAVTVLFLFIIAVFFYLMFRNLEYYIDDVCKQVCDLEGDLEYKLQKEVSGPIKENKMLYEVLRAEMLELQGRFGSMDTGLSVVKRMIDFVLEASREEAGSEVVILRLSNAMMHLEETVESQRSLIKDLSSKLTSCCSAVDSIVDMIGGAKCSTLGFCEVVESVSRDSGSSQERRDH